MANAKSQTIVINEVDCHGNDWVELLNKSNGAVDISNWLLTDKKLSVTNPLHIYRFPAGTVIGKGARLVVEQSGTGEQKLPFGIGCLKGGVIRLGQPLSPTSMVLVDELTIAITPSGATYGRVPDGAVTSGITLHSKGSINVSALPVIKSNKALTCRKNKDCKFQLKASLGTKFSVTANSLGAKVSNKGLLQIPKSKVKSAKLKIKLANSYGATFVLLTISVR
ncbi:MAG: lamin tail domain-containing protein [Actinomycetales bacterium]|nr:lamin tail domain-containing protein [Actinomycetales bacterium]